MRVDDTRDALVVDVAAQPRNLLEDCDAINRSRRYTPLHVVTHRYTRHVRTCSMIATLSTVAPRHTPSHPVTPRYTPLHPVTPRTCSMMAMPSSSALCASIAPRTQSPIASARGDAWHVRQAGAWHVRQAGAWHVRQASAWHVRQAGPGRGREGARAARARDKEMRRALQM